MALFLFVSLSSCERGALTHWLASHGVGEDQNSPARAGSLHLHEVDCPAGLVRCVEGILELAQPARHPEPCKGPSESCACPWQAVGRCDDGCVSDGVAVLLEGPRAQRQLCLPGPRDPLVGAPPPAGAAPPSPCGDELFRCTRSMVIGCTPPRVVASCVRGCAEEEATLDDELASDSAAVNILCSR